MGQFEERVTITEPAGADRMRTSTPEINAAITEPSAVAPDAGINLAQKDIPLPISEVDF